MDRQRHQRTAAARCPADLRQRVPRRHDVFQDADPLSADHHHPQPGHDGSAWGANGNHIKVNWVGPGGQDMIVYKGVNGVTNRMLFLEKFSFFGNGYAGAPAGDCLKLGHPMVIRARSTSSPCATSSRPTPPTASCCRVRCSRGWSRTCTVRTTSRMACMMQHERVGDANQAIVSNVALIHPNMSRNFGAGIRQVYSANSIMGSYVLNGEGGIVAPDGLRAPSCRTARIPASACSTWVATVTARPTS